jgi:hypothetical protein
MIGLGRCSLEFPRLLMWIGSTVVLLVAGARGLSFVLQIYRERFELTHIWITSVLD